ncbi:Atxe2 family lasso peptide isopeptidase [Phenylobacterium montanum]|uniref:Atxe2 family lasso peptide isopeptidase n=1 Tax=Phenylobacterium montanum TaxID=2823693 RepID=A0A975IX06_9CAUL|nr:Atxe2 family lasso peptide isopeptidase [Caulobacter sp. S6]QUD90134.1 Atxe2 family lasso peptide isopeptidase [Caulobacter sp. S6]
MRILFLSAALSMAWLVASPASQAAPSPKSLVEVADLDDVAISPDGRSVAFRQYRASVESNRYDLAWLVAPIGAGGSVVRVADGGEPLFTDAGTVVVEPPAWSPDSRFFYYRALVGGEVQVWRAAADGSRTEAVTHDAADVTWFALSPDGRSLIYAAGADREAVRRAEQTEYDDGVRIDGSIPIGQGLVRSGWVDGRLATQRFSGDWMQRQGLLAGAPERKIVVEISTFASHPASGADLALFSEALEIKAAKARASTVLGPDLATRSPQTGMTAYVETGSSGSILKIKAADGKVEDCPAGACGEARIVALNWRAGGRQLVFTTLDRKRGRAESLRVWDLASGQVRILVQAKGLIGGGRDSYPGEGCAVAAAFAACVTAAADDPPRLEQVGLDTDERRVLYDPNAALAAARGPRAEFLSWQDAAGRSFTGWLFPPVKAVAGPAPLFITYYVCPGYLRGGLGDEWPLASLAGAGIAALCINDAPPDLKHPDALADYQAAASAVQSAVRLLQARGLVDPARVGMGGLSFGSEAVLWTIMNSSQLVAASVTSPAITPTYFQFHTLQGANFRDMLRSQWGLGAPAETPERWRRISPAFNLDKLRTPILMQMPEQEYLEALDYFTPLASRGGPVELYAFPNEPHIKIQPRHKLAAYRRNLDWFRFWLQAYEDPDPRKADQYRRWRTLRDHLHADAAAAR